MSQDNSKGKKVAQSVCHRIPRVV